jgi:cytidine deaminase
MTLRKIETLVRDYDNTDELSENYKMLITKAKDALERAYVPYSKFHVGAAVLLENGEIITATNQENAAYPSGLCAERVAIFYANSLYPNVAVSAIAVTAAPEMKQISQPVPPCGGCRQVLLETETRFQKPITIILAGEHKISVLESAKSLLPMHFDEAFLDS